MVEDVTEGMVKFKKRPGYIWRQYWDWQLFINQGWRQASLVAMTGADFLFEYYSAKGDIYLHEVRIGRDGRFQDRGKSVDFKLPLKWQIEWL